MTVVTMRMEHANMTELSNAATASGASLRNSGATPMPASPGGGSRGFARAWLLGGAIMLGSLLGLSYWDARPTAVGAGRDTAAQTDCATWDRAAAEGIAAIIADRGAAAELRLDEAILQLRRARKNCRAGLAALARRDYASLQQTFPSSTGAIRATPRVDQAEAIFPPLR